MKNFYKIIGGVVVSGILIASVPVVASAQSLKTNSNCKATIKSGWNLMSLASLTCVAFAVESDNVLLEKFPSYLDLYAYNGVNYTYARVTKNNIRGGNDRSIEDGISKYTSNIVSKATDGKFLTLENVNEDAFLKELFQSNTTKTKEYAGRMVKEVFTSIWVYNPGKDYVVNIQRDNQGEIAIANALSANVSATEANSLLDSFENLATETLREVDRTPGARNFLNQLMNGGIYLDKGWSFLTYNILLADSDGKINLSKGGCNISKAYLFDNNSKKWVDSSLANKLMFGAGLVVYNAGNECNLLIENSVVARLRSMTGSGPRVTPPTLPN